GARPASEAAIARRVQGRSEPKNTSGPRGGADRTLLHWEEAGVHATLSRSNQYRQLDQGELKRGLRATKSSQLPPAAPGRSCGCGRRAADAAQLRALRGP